MIDLHLTDWWGADYISPRDTVEGYLRYECDKANDQSSTSRRSKNSGGI
jgi:hypothetical protein